MKASCFQCGSEINLRPSALKERNFCSKNCHNEYQREKNKRIEIECEGCGEPLFLTYNEYHVKKIRRCSFKCREKRVITNCEVCGKVMNLKYADYHSKKIRRCSFECRKKKPKPCEHCGEIMLEYQTNQKYCSIECKGLARKGPNHPLWNGGRYETQGYIYIYTGEKHEREHRYLMAREIGRPLKPYEEVHHIDFNRKNNDIKNLVLLTKAQHTALHNKLDSYDLEGIDKQELYNLTTKLLSEEGIEI